LGINVVAYGALPSHQFSVSNRCHIWGGGQLSTSSENG
jgi:hypothetical protein